MSHPDESDNDKKQDKESLDYEVKQDLMDRDYIKHWDNAPQEFKEQASRLGIEAKIDSRNGQTMEFKEEFATEFHTPDMAETLDTEVDRLVERYGEQHQEIIRLVAEDLKAPMEREVERGRAMLLGRVVCLLVKSEHKNILASIHQLLHSIPRLAAINGFRSMRASALACGVSPEWIKKGRDNWCEQLGIPIPAEGQKTADAKKKYKANGDVNHWRSRKMKATPLAGNRHIRTN